MYALIVVNDVKDVGTNKFCGRRRANARHDEN